MDWKRETARSGGMKEGQDLPLDGDGEELVQYGCQSGGVGSKQKKKGRGGRLSTKKVGKKVWVCWDELVRDIYTKLKRPGTLGERNLA